MSTDTAFALGMLALVGSRYPTSLRAFILTVAVVDDLVALVVIAVAFTSEVHVVALAVGITMFVLILVLRYRGVHNGGPYLLLGLAAWVAFLQSGIDPIVVGLAMGLLTIAYPAAREDLERATDLFRVFREQPTSELQQSARAGLRSAISPNERWQQMFHPFTSYVIVPAVRAGQRRVRDQRRVPRARLQVGDHPGHHRRLRAGQADRDHRRGRPGDQAQPRPDPAAGRVGVGAGRRRGRRHRVHRLAADRHAGLHRRAPRRGQGRRADHAGRGTDDGWAIIGVTYRLPKKVKARLLIGRGETIVDLAAPVDPERDHIRGPRRPPVTLVEYGDLECPYCGQAERSSASCSSDFGDLRYVWRHLPLNDVHPHAQLAAEAAEAAGAQGKFWEMHDLLLSHQDALTLRDLIGYAEELGLDIERFRGHLRKRKGSARIAEDVESADMSGVSGTPTFFINGHRHQDAYDIDTLSKAVRLARVRAAITA